MAQDLINVGIIGVNPEGSWASFTHIPALNALPAFRLQGVCATSAAKAQAVAQAHNVRLAFSDHRELVAHPEIDLVVITTKAPTHYELVKSALEAGKSVFCEWPLGSNLQETEVLAELAAKKAVRTMVGLQGRASRFLRTLRRLLAEGVLGDVLSSSVILGESTWGGETRSSLAYTLDDANGANIVSIASGHALDVICSALGEFSHLDATLATMFDRVSVVDKQEQIVATAPDHAIVGGRLNSGALLSYHIRPSQPYQQTVDWRIFGTKGEILIRSDDGLLFVHDLPILLRRNRDPGFTEIRLDSELEALTGLPLGIHAQSVARLYAQFADDVARETQTVPDFGAALDRHRTIDAIYQAAKRRPGAGGANL